MPETHDASMAVIGGTGLEEAFASLDRHETIPTPYGPTSAPVALGTLAGRSVAFLPRHGAGHALPPGAVPARANLWALARLGVRAIVSSAAVGSLDASFAPGSLAVPDQLLDRTHGRADSYFDGEPGMDVGPVRHLPFADPFCPVVREAVRAGLPDAADGATVAVIPGPRFSTRAESRALRAAGADLVNMTLLPEVALACELGIGVATVCVVTDMDAGVDADDAERVSADIVYARFAEALPRVVAGIERAVDAIPHDYAGRMLLDDRARPDVLDRPARDADPRLGR
ncbi:MTAP family purine nucleoside phosphorylase [Microbacter sp. GSS18]|nr:MTAP family purine nucleoside phosphorylase [Microbacter sp. GSS18]